MPITRPIVATALLALAIGGSAAAQAAERDVARTGLRDMTVTRQDVPRVARTGLRDITTRAPQRVATQTPDRTPWLLITASALLAATAAVLHYRARRRRSAVAR